jgi:hypothetical protein
MWLEITKNQDVRNRSFTLKGRLFIRDPLRSWSLRLLGRPFAHRCQKHWWRHLTNITTTETKSEDGAHLNPIRIQTDILLEHNTYLVCFSFHTHHYFDNHYKFLNQQWLCIGGLHSPILQMGISKVGAVFKKFNIFFLHIKSVLSCY